MKRELKTDAQLEAMLRAGAKTIWRSAPDGLSARVMSEIRAAEARRVNVERSASGDRGGVAGWNRAAIAAALAMAATLAVAIVLLRDAPSPMVAANGAAGGLADVDLSDDAPPGPMAMFASLHRAPEELGSALRDAVSNEIYLIVEEAVREQQLFLARLPLRGRIDPDAGAVFDPAMPR